MAQTQSLPRDSSGFEPSHIPSVLEPDQGLTTAKSNRILGIASPILFTNPAFGKATITPVGQLLNGESTLNDFFHFFGTIWVFYFKGPSKLVVSSWFPFEPTKKKGVPGVEKKPRVQEKRSRTKAESVFVCFCCFLLFLAFWWYLFST